MLRSYLCMPETGHIVKYIVTIFALSILGELKISKVVNVAPDCPYKVANHPHEIVDHPHEVSDRPHEVADHPHNFPQIVV